MPTPSRARSGATAFLIRGVGGRRALLIRSGASGPDRASPPLERTGGGASQASLGGSTCCASRGRSERCLHGWQAGRLWAGSEEAAPGLPRKPRAEMGGRRRLAHELPRLTWREQPAGEKARRSPPHAPGAACFAARRVRARQ